MGWPRGGVGGYDVGMGNRRTTAWLPVAWVMTSSLVSAALAADVPQAPESIPFWIPLTVAIVLVLCVFGVSIISSRRDPNG